MIYLISEAKVIHQAVHTKVASHTANSADITLAEISDAAAAYMGREGARINIGDNEASKMQAEIVKEVKKVDKISSMHGFYVDFKRKVISFDIVVDFSVADAVALMNDLEKTLSAEYPDFRFNIVLNNNYSDETE